VLLIYARLVAAYGSGCVMTGNVWFSCVCAVKIVATFDQAFFVFAINSILMYKLL
jgi:hypothetical protein